MRLFIFAVLFPVMTAPALAQGALQGKLVGCANIADAAQRHACFDALVPELKQISEAQFGAPAVKPSALTAPIGAVAAAPAAPAEPDKVKLQISSVSRSADGLVTFMMENGQVWTQADNKQLGSYNKGPWSAEIRKAMGGSFLMQINGGGSIRVKRIK
ncbi:MAG: hypothetical protein Q8R82_05185 [Hyphomonadaceae bacterium]|nr:hypothetical protein [Hyphomonadaceae bacterium]